MNKVLDKDKKIKHYSDKIQKLLKEINNKKKEIKINLNRLAELQDCKVFIIPSIYDEVKFYDYVIANSKEDANDYGICVSIFDDIHEIEGDGKILYDETFEMI